MTYSPFDSLDRYKDIRENSETAPINPDPLDKSGALPPPGQPLPPKQTQQPQNPQQEQVYPNQPQEQTLDSLGKKNTNIPQEIGTALIGGPIDALESIGATTEAAVKGQMLNPDFKPTWLQVQDDKEPMNQTVWGNFLRGIGEYAVLNAVLRRGARGLKAAKVPGAARLSRATTMDPKKAQMKGLKGFKARATDMRSTIREASFGAAADFTSSYSEGETLSNLFNERFPDIPLWTSVDADDSPLERKLKNVVEGIGLGKLTDLLFAWRAAKNMELQLPPGVTDKAQIEFLENQYSLQANEIALANIAEKFKPGGKLTPAELSFLRKKDPTFNTLYTSIRAQTERASNLEKAMDPKLLAEAKMINSADARQKNYDEYAEWRNLQDPDFFNPDGYRNGPVFDPPDKGIFSAKGGYVKALRDQYRMDTDFSLRNGRMPNLTTESALEQRLSQFDPQRRKVIEKISENLVKQMEGTDEAFGLSNEQLKNLSIAKYVDLVDEVANKPDDINAIKELISYDTINLGKGEMKVLSMDNHAAIELLIHSTAGEISDLAQGARSIDGVVDNSRPIEALLTRLEFLLMETGKAKYIAGFRLQALKNMEADFKLPDARAANAKIREMERGVKEYVKELKGVWKTDPQSVKGWLDVVALTNGSPQALDQMYKWARNKVFNWKSLFSGKEENKSAFFDALVSIMYNSVLSGPKTLFRAALGNTSMLVMRPLATLLGGFFSGNDRMVALGFHQMQAGREAIGEAFKVFGQAWSAGKNNLENIPYLATQRLPPTMDPEWKSLGEVLEKNGNWGDLMAYQMTTALYNFNNFIGVKYPMVTMNAIDAASNVIFARMEAKNAAFMKAWDVTGGNTNGTKNLDELMKTYEDEAMKTIFDKSNPNNPVITDKRANYLADEAGLKLSLKGKSVPILGMDLEDIERMTQRGMVIRPFFLFMKTGWNALEVIQKHTPILARFNDEYRAVMSAQAGDLSRVAQYGITSPAQLMEAQAMMQGRIAIGYLTVAAAIGLYTQGRLTGNGPYDRETSNAWKTMTAYSPRSIIITDDFKISTDSLEPFNSILNMVSDIGDNANGLGEAATENLFRKVGFMIASNVTNKSFLAGLQPFGELISLQSGPALAVYLSNIANQQVPWAGLRKELANVFEPGRRELEKDIRKALDNIKNRNPGLRSKLPIQRDYLDNSVVEGWSWPIRFFNALSPIQLSGKDSEVRRRLRESGFDLVAHSTTMPDGTKMDAEMTNKFNEIFASYEIEKNELEDLMLGKAFENELIEIRSLRNANVRSRTGEDGDRITGVDLNTFPMYGKMVKVFNQYKKRAFDELMEDPANAHMKAAYYNRLEAQSDFKQGNFNAGAQRLLLEKLRQHGKE